VLPLVNQVPIMGFHCCFFS